MQVRHLEEYRQSGQLDVIQEKYSMLDRRVEEELLPYCEANSVTLQTYSPIEQGLLTGTVPGQLRSEARGGQGE